MVGGPIQAQVGPCADYNATQGPLTILDGEMHRTKSNDVLFVEATNIVPRKSCCWQKKEMGPFRTMSLVSFGHNGTCALFLVLDDEARPLLYQI